jgi:hypothetical protein
MIAGYSSPQPIGNDLKPTCIGPVDITCSLQGEAIFFIVCPQLWIINKTTSFYPDHPQHWFFKAAAAAYTVRLE